jgi:hypothetical protein
MRAYGVPAEVLSDNGKQFMGRFGKPRPAEVQQRRHRHPVRDIGHRQQPKQLRTTGQHPRLHRLTGTPRRAAGHH